MDGEGVSHIDGLAVFIPYTLIGEIVKVQVIQIKKRFAIAKVIKVIKPVDRRVKPICGQFYKCGGCDLMHIDYAFHDEIKISKLANCLKKTAKIEPKIDDMVKAGGIYGYRNKIQLPFAKINNKIRVGYFMQDTHKVIPFDKCYLQDDWADNIINLFLEYADRKGLSVYNEKNGEGLLRHIILRKINEVVSIVVVINGDFLPEINEFITELNSNGVKFNLHLNFNKNATNVITGKTFKLLYGKDSMECDINNIKFSLHPESFMQVNTEVAKVLYNRINTELSKMNKPIVIEGYSGIGLLSNVISGNVKKIISVEIIEKAVENAKELALINGNADKIINICADAVKAIPLIMEGIRLRNFDRLITGVNLKEVEKKKLNEIISVEKSALNRTEKCLIDPELVVLVDPPRKGCDSEILNAILKASPDKIMYISCNPSTLARDLAVLLNHYRIDSVTPYDMFPLTSHVETLVCLGRM